MKKLILTITIIVVIYSLHLASLRAKRVTATVLRAIDGDTIELVNGKSVRLLGIDAPEYGEEFSIAATNRLKELVEGKTVELEKDVSEKDSFGRLLRYIFVKDAFVNLQMVKEGYAYAYVVSPDEKYLKEFIAAEEEARNKALNIWSGRHKNCLMVKFHYNARGNDNDNLNDEYVIFKNLCADAIDMTGWKVRDENGNSFYFPQFVLCSSCLAVLHSGFGEDSGNNLYWKSNIAIWNNDGDTLWLYDENGKLILRESYRGYK